MSYADLECPYCGADQEVNHDDGGGYEEGVTHQQECDECGKTYVFTTSISFSYWPEKADCLNDGGEHKWKPTMTAPKYFTKMRCTMCDEERTPTDEERTQYNIPFKYEL